MPTMDPLDLLKTRRSVKPAELAAPGFYTAITAQERLRIAVNVLDRKTTEVNRSGLAPAAGTDASPLPSSRPDPWLILLLAALALLAFEWWSWNRRMTL